MKPMPHFADQVESLLVSLQDVWFSHRTRDLEVRHQVGSLLNDQLGPPVRRQAYAEGVIRRVSDELDIDKSDISRMRRFAAIFPTLERLYDTYPEATSWTRVRNLITTQKRTNSPADHRLAQGVLRSLEASASSLRRADTFRGPIAERLRLALRDVVIAAEKAIGFQLEES